MFQRFNSLHMKHFYVPCQKKTENQIPEDSLPENDKKHKLASLKTL